LQTQTITAAPSRLLSDSLSQRITRIEQENSNLRLKVEYLDKLYDKRFDDFTKWLGILIAVIVGGVILIGFNANSTARKQAIEELNSLQNKIASIDQKSDEISITLSSMEQQTEAFERLRQSQLGDNNG
jgi:type VI protein secretion system component VasK